MRVSQIDLVTVLGKYLDKRGIKTLAARQMNVIFESCSAIADAVNSEVVLTTPGMTLGQWLDSDDTGLSSERLCYVLTGKGRGFQRNNHPHDPDDLGRCIRFLDAFPDLRQKLPEMAKHGKVWAALVEHWEQLETLYREELPSGMAPKTYELMKKLGC